MSKLFRAFTAATVASALVSHSVIAQATKHPAKKTSSAVAAQPPLIVVLPVDSTGGDSIRVIVQRDLENGDRLLSAFVDPVTLRAAAPIGRDSIDFALLAPAKAANVVRIARHPARLAVSIYDGITGASRRSGEFHLPVIPDDRSQLIRDSLAQELTARAVAANAQLARDSVVRDSLLRLNSAPPPKKKPNTKERAALRLAAAQRDSTVKEIEQRRLDIFAAARHDTVARDSILPLMLTADSLTRYNANKNYRMALHSLSDEVEQWITGTRGISATRIAYVQGRNLHLIDSDGGIDEIIRTPGAAMSPAWHPAGKSIVYSDFTDSGTQIGEVDLVTDSVHLVAATPRGLNITPVYSPDGTKIVFGAGGERPADLVVYERGTGLHPVPLSTGKFENSSPTFSPDGTRMAFMSPRPALTPQIYVMNSDGTKVKLLTPFAKGKRSYRTGPDWSPTGEAVAYEQQNGDFQVWMINVKSGKMTQLTKVKENEDPSWAPDGRHMAVTSTRGGTREIWVLDTKTGHFRQVTHREGARLAAWSPYLRVAQ